MIQMGIVDNKSLLEARPETSLKTRHTTKNMIPRIFRTSTEAHKDAGRESTGAKNRGPEEHGKGGKINTRVFLEQGWKPSQNHHPRKD